MLFNRIYRALQSQRLSPLVNYRVRLWWASARREHRRDYLQLMQQVVGARWLLQLQAIDVDGTLLRRGARVGLLLLFIGFCVYLII